MIQNLDVYLWGQKVGSLTTYQAKYTERVCFYFDAVFANGSLDIAPLRASIRSKAVQNGLPIYAEEEKIFGGLPSFIADSLPDNWGNRVFEEWAKANHIRLRDITALDRLAYMGRRGMGALEFLPPAAEEMESSFKVRIADLYEQAQVALAEAETFHASLGRDIMLQSLFKVGTSAGGRRPKAIINVNPDTMECYSGQVATPASGFIPMIIKFQEQGDIPTPRIEYSYYLMANAIGLRMMPSRIVKNGSLTHFLTERFDRRGEQKLHVQTLAAMNPSASSYEDLFDVACRIGIVPTELQQIFLQMVMNVLSANVDDHNKNFSFMMAPDGIWHVAPAYDFTFSIDTAAPWYVNRHNMTINGRDTDFSCNDMLEVARRFNIKKAKTIIDNAIIVTKLYPQFAKEAGVEERWSKCIFQEIEKRVAWLES
jgi:serine/threonine-protein kinase HipA